MRGLRVSAPSEDSSLMLAWRGFRGYLPLFEGKTTHSAWLVSQLLQGTFNITSHFTLRRLHSLQACLARDRLLLPFIMSLLTFPCSTVSREQTESTLHAQRFS